MTGPRSTRRTAPGPPATAAPLFDPFAPGFTDDPYPQYAAVRTATPAYLHPMGFWLLTRYEDVSMLLRQAALSVEDRNLPGSPLQRLRGDSYGDNGQSVVGLCMLDRDPPDHTRLRRLFSKAFTPRAIQRLSSRITELVDGMLAGIAREERVDLIESLAFPLPFKVIAEMLGTPPADHERIRELAGTKVRALEPVADPGLEAAIAAADAELTGIIAEMIAWKRKNPADDLLSVLTNVEDNGDMLSNDELVAQTMLIYIAGHETTVNAIAGGMLALLRHPAQLALLRNEPVLVPNAVEELLRYDSPVQASRRITTEPITIQDITIPVGSFVMASLASANRDHRFWGAEADSVRVYRQNARQHVSFGAGVHHCLGAALARLEAGITFERIVNRFPRLALDGEVTWNGRINLRGPARLPVSVR